MLLNAFDLSPLVSNIGMSRLPHLVVPGSVSPIALGYDMPSSQLDEFNFIPRITDDLQTWFGFDLYPQYFIIQTTNNAGEVYFNVQPNLTNWPGNAGHIFQDLEIMNKN
jgi:hypothetical protein